jgi:hypothetical protein
MRTATSTAPTSVRVGVVAVQKATNDAADDEHK